MLSEVYRPFQGGIGSYFHGTIEVGGWYFLYGSYLPAMVVVGVGGSG